MLQNGYTPLHIAAKRNRAEVAAAALKHGANPNAESVVRTWFLLNVIIHVFYVLCHCHSWLQSLLSFTASFSHVGWDFTFVAEGAKYRISLSNYR